MKRTFAICIFAAMVIGSFGAAAEPWQNAGPAKFFSEN